MKRRLFGNLLLACLAMVGLAVAGASAHADELAEVKARGKLIVGVKNDYPPFGYLTPDGRLVGFEVDLAKYVANELLGSPDAIEFVPVVAANRIQFLQAGRIDLILATLGQTPERALIIDFTIPAYSAGGPMLIVRKDSPVTSWETARDHTFCSIQGSYYLRKLTEELGLKLVNFTGLPDVYKALDDSRCEGVAFDEGTLAKKIVEPGFADRYRVAALPYEHLPQPGGVRKNEPAFLDAVNAAIVKASAQGKMLEWEKTYEMPPTDYVAEMARQSRVKLGM
ncbi:MAG TPA: transporter substrate-binding domain-containing protein [Stellaceae bacterium]|nr:transporter substrate-binding domain-containing protein [Stellaceae bacterium]